jgi:hypothetical protein
VSANAVRNSPATTSTTIAKPTSTAIASDRHQRVAGVRALADTPAETSSRSAWSAGTMATSSAQPSPSASATPRPSASTEAWNRIGSAAVSRTARSACTPQAASIAPSPAPHSPMTTASASSSRATCHGDAPTASRTASSRWRDAERASSSVAVLPHTARSSTSINPWSTLSAWKNIRCGPRGARQ